jgi:hypothetical protein
LGEELVRAVIEERTLRALWALAKAPRAFVEAERFARNDVRARVSRHHCA